MVTVRRDPGATLVEMLISVVLLGTVGVAVLAGMSTAIVAARTHDDVATVQSRLAQAGDVITDTEPEQITYVACAAVDNYQTPLGAMVAGVTVTGVEYWDGDAPDPSFGTVCHHADGHRLQRITLSATKGDVTRTITVVKRPFAVPTVNVQPAPPVPPYTGGSGQATVSLTPGINGGPTP